MELTHLCGYLEIKKGLEANQVLNMTNQLLDLLRKNIPSFQDSSAYLGIRFREGVYLVCLNASPIFLTKWSEEDIAEVLNVQLFDLIGSLITNPPEPIKLFGVD